MGFKFRDNAVVLDFEGKIFNVDAFDMDIIDKLEQVGNKATEISKVVDGKPAKEQVSEMMDFMVDSIDSILGINATKEIFGSRMISFLDLLDIFNYISDEIKDSRNDIANRYSPDRVKR